MYNQLCAGKCPAALALMIYTFIFFWFVGGLSGFHTYLVARNQTTYENFRYNHSSMPNPYNMGILRNCGSIWCVRIPPSKVDFRYDTAFTVTMHDTDTDYHTDCDNASNRVQHNRHIGHSCCQVTGSVFVVLNLLSSDMLIRI